MSRSNSADRVFADQSTLDLWLQQLGATDSQIDFLLPDRLAESASFAQGNVEINSSCPSDGLSVLYKPECAVTDAVALQHASLSAASADDTLTFTAFSGDAATEAFNGGAAHGLSIANGAVVEINGASDEPVRFTGATGTLQLDDAPAFNGQISGLTGADTLDLRDISFSANTTATYLGNVAGGTLTITDGIDKANIRPGRQLPVVNVESFE